MKIILIFVYCFILNIICLCFKIDKIYESNKKKLYFFTKKNIIKRPKTGSSIYNCINSKLNDDDEIEIREKIKKENERREKIKAENNSYVNSNFKYVSNNIPINVEKKYSYESFKYSEEIAMYVFFVINLFKHEQFKNKIYKESLEIESSQNINRIQSDDLFDKSNNTVERNKKLVKNFLNKFGDSFKFFNSHEKVQREDWANMFKLEQNDKNNFFKNVKVKSEKTKEYYFVIYYCNWKYECMALYNAFHNIMNNAYNNVNFYNIFDKRDKCENIKEDNEKKNELSKSDIEKIREMYIEDLQNNETMDIESLIKKDKKLNECNNDQDQTMKNSTENEQTNESKEKGNTNNKINETNLFHNENAKKNNKTFQDIMEEEKKKLDEEFFLYGYSKYENIEEIKKEEEMIKQTKKLIEEEKLSHTKLNSEKDFKNILKNFYIQIKNYKDFYNYHHKEKNILKNDINSYKNTEKISREFFINNDNSNITQVSEEKNKKDEKQEVNINVIFVRLSNSTVIGKTKNIKKKIKKKWIYSQEKEIKFYELILSVMLNENIYYKNIPHMDIFSLSYDKKNLYDFFNLINSNIKHSFIHRNNVYDIFNNVINDQMDIYNFNIYDESLYKEHEFIQNENSKDKLIDNEVKHKEYIENDDIVLEELDSNYEIDDLKNYKVIYDQNENNIDESNKELEKEVDQMRNEEGLKLSNNRMKEKKTDNIQYKIMKKKHNKKEKSKYEVLFKQKYTNIFVNNIRSKLLIEKVSSISNVDIHANYTVDTFKDLPLSDILKNTYVHQNFKIDKNYVYYLNQRIPKELFPFILQLSLAFKYEHTTIMLNAPKKIEFEFRNV
ncbi:conserved Plasmodium protein, unknown function [Plasmodium gallinaceum]|uniref:Uncharacterized protein n=1 Tax=Plasmodium gallinaceum TaxID=5849 RepID=A0A1J1GP33_PLAGA|nr:conserved Plasmodium protein, unknown function [Plasmodium gallinaceum]CRG94054.1 conserved Plasmodium protein, unknown function [Plasmodium gallinaceum]